MFEIRIHGRGGQGVVTAADLLSVAAFLDGQHAQAFPSFGSERMGAPVMAFCRIDDIPIRVREPVARPGALIIQDATLLVAANGVFTGLRPDGYVLINSVRRADELQLPGVVAPDRLVTVPASHLALEHVGRPVPNAALLGGFAALTGRVSLGSVLTAITERFTGRIAAGNAAAAEEAFALVRTQQKEAAHA
jgi:pyruvate ferredoxin oxidoreductase gamma subunit